MSLSLSTVERFVPLAARKGVSEVARSLRGYVGTWSREDNDIRKNPRNPRRRR